MNDSAYIGPFFYIHKKLIAHKLPVSQGEKRGGKIDNPYSHEKLYDSKIDGGDYINIPRGRVIWDIKAGRAIIYIDACIEKSGGAVEKIAELFGLTDYVIEYDEHYVCPNCMGDIWE